MRILFFGRLAERFGRTVDVDVANGCTVAQLRQQLTLDDRAIRACVGDTLVGEDFTLTGIAEVEFWPRVSGG